MGSTEGERSINSGWSYMNYNFLLWLF
jgi:hypothetical protein